MSKQKFSSKGGFILASIGAAVGLGNALRFPGLCANTAAARIFSFI